MAVPLRKPVTRLFTLSKRVRPFEADSSVCVFSGLLVMLKKDTR
jgi:hypothetical protein